MKKKTVILTKHAQERFEQRDIRLEQVKRAIFDPHIIIPVWGKKKRVMRDFGNRSLDVIYVEKESVIIIVTAVWLKEKERFKDVEDR